jgi:hypothetical protein
MAFIQKAVYLTVGFSLFLSGIQAQSAQVKFVDATEDAGIHFKYTFGDDTYENILESSGSGVSVLDYNGDGYMDLYLLNGTYIEGISDPAGVKYANTANHLYRNNADGTFTEVGALAGLDNREWSMAAGVTDYDNDGDEDVYLLNYGPNSFYINQGDGTFLDRAAELGLVGPEKLNGYTKWSVGVAFWDYNRDGALDLMTGNFLAFDPAYTSPSAPEMMPHPNEYDGQASLFYRQEPDETFTDITKELGLFYPDSKCMGLTIFDYDDDGDLDLFQGNDHQFNFMFRNDGTQLFKEVAIASGIAANDHGEPTGSMHGSVGDVDGDGLLDVLVTDLKHGALYRNRGQGLFEDITSRSGVADAFAGKGGWAAALFDYDNDGDLDIFSATGTAEELILQYPLLLENDGTGNFTNIGFQTGDYFRKKRSGRGAAIWDCDNDGDLDIIVSHVDLEATPALLRNDGGNQNNWLGLTLIGKHGPASALGAKVFVIAGTGVQKLVNQPANGYLSYNDPRLHVGLGKNSKVDRLEIHWLDGEIEVIHNVLSNQYIRIMQGKGIQH